MKKKKKKEQTSCLAGRLIPSGLLMKLLDKVYCPSFLHPNPYFSKSKGEKKLESNRKAAHRSPQGRRTRLGC